MQNSSEVSWVSPVITGSSFAILLSWRGHLLTFSRKELSSFEKCSGHSPGAVFAQF
jgi:hypothetical protein